MSRCLLVSNRLPVFFDAKKKTFLPSSGGLVSAIQGLDASKMPVDFEWMGLLTDDIDPQLVQQLNSSHEGSIPNHPIIVSKKTYDDYYNLYCNNVLWPLFHYERNMVRHRTSGWSAYLEINKLVAEAILEEAKDEDIVWVHDFQLMLVPGMVKDKRPNLKLGFFLHIPFPSSEIFRELPQRKEILLSLMKADQLGFHDMSYLNHFRSSIQRVLGEVPSQEKAWGVYPISIDSKYFENLTHEEQTLEFNIQYKDNKRKMKWIVGVDRLDYTKGLLLKLSAYKTFLRNFPKERGKVQLVQVVIPSRIDVPEYRALKNRLEQLVSSINGEFGSPSWMPIQYIYHSVSPNELSALYQMSDVLFVTSRRDGMNLVSLEYVISQNEKSPGVVVLSEFAGSHSTLTYAFSINPWDIQETAKKLKDALHHPEVKRRFEIKAMQDFLKKYTSSDWARINLEDILKQNSVREKNHSLASESGHFPWMEKMAEKKILFFCDLDGTLAPIISNPKEVRLQSETINLLQQIALKKQCDFVIVSGRDKEFLEEQFIDHDFDFPLAACHGAYSYSPKENRWRSHIPQDSTKWKETVHEILELYTSRTPGSFVEDKGHALTWHYRNCPKDFAEFLATKLFFELEEALAGLPVQVHRGKKIIEVKSIYASKGHFVQEWIKSMKKKPDVVLAIGDDTTDEDMFAALQERRDFESFCIKVGEEKTHAHYVIKVQEQVGNFLKHLVKHLK